MNNNIKTEIALDARKHVYEFLLETLSSDEFVDKMHEAFWRIRDLTNWKPEEINLAGNTMFKVLVGIIGDIQRRK